MRTEAEIMAMHDRIARRNLIFGDTGYGVAQVVFNWVCDRLVSDSEVFAVAESLDDDEDGELRSAAVGASLIDTAADEDWNAWGEYLSRVKETQLKELATAAQKIDRLCKAEVNS